MGSLYNGTEWTDYDAVKDNETSIYKEALEAAVHRQLMSDVPYGVFQRIRFLKPIIAKKYARKRSSSGDVADAWHPQCHSSVGSGRVSGSAAAQIVDHIGTIHHEIKFYNQEGLDAIRDVIYNLKQ
jgi:asparagine synthase (glutamine-hydrolysing)